MVGQMNTSGGAATPVTSGLLGIEVGRSLVRLALLDDSAKRVLNIVERPIAKAGGPRDPIEEEASTRQAIEEGLDRLSVDGSSQLRVGVTIGFRNCGVGSGPALEGWLISLSEEIDQPIISTDGDGVSYCPSQWLAFTRQVLEPTVVSANSILLAPVAASRVLGPVQSVSMKLGSGIAWSARILNNQVLEAFETLDGALDEPIHLLVDNDAQLVTSLTGVEIDQELCRNRGISEAALAPCVGAAVSLLDVDGANLLDGSPVGSARREFDIDLRGGPFDTWDGGNGIDSPAPPASATVAPSAGPVDTEALLDRGGASAPAPAPADFAAGAPYDETYKLRKLPRTVARSKELPDEGQYQRPTANGSYQAASQQHGNAPLMPTDYAEVDALGHDEALDNRGFQISDFLLGALGMLAIVLFVALLL